MAIRLRLLFTFLIILPAACSRTAWVSTPLSQPQTSGVNPILVQMPPDAPPTATPFMPLPPTAAYDPTAFPTQVPTATEIPTPTPTPANTPFESKSWEDYPGPTVWPDIDIPAPVGLLPQPNGQINILLLGSDQRPNDGGFRTDTILLLTLNPKENTAHLTSFPRDLYVYIPGWTIQRINTAFQHGGFNSLATTFEYNFGVRPDYYMLVNFWSFTKIIDDLDGIDVQVAVSLRDSRDGYGTFYVPSGQVHMDGETALWYVRSRYTTSDFDRGRRQQEVIKAIFQRMLTLNAIARAPEMYNLYKSNVSTNIGLDTITPLLSLALQLNQPDRLVNYYISPKDVTQWRNSAGAYVLLPNRDAILGIMKQALNSP